MGWQPSWHKEAARIRPTPPSPSESLAEEHKPCMSFPVGEGDVPLASSLCADSDSYSRPHRALAAKLDAQAVGGPDGGHLSLCAVSGTGGSHHSPSAHPEKDEASDSFSEHCHVCPVTFRILLPVPPRPRSLNRPAPRLRPALRAPDAQTAPRDSTVPSPMSSHRGDREEEPFPAARAIRAVCLPRPVSRPHWTLPVALVPAPQDPASSTAAPLRAPSLSHPPSGCGVDSQAGACVWTDAQTSLQGPVINEGNKAMAQNFQT